MVISDTGGWSFPLTTRLKWESKLPANVFGNGDSVLVGDGAVMNLMGGYPYIGIEINTMSFTFPSSDHSAPKVKIANYSLTDTSSCFMESMVPMERNVEDLGGGNI